MHTDEQIGPTQITNYEQTNEDVEEDFNVVIDDEESHLDNHNIDTGSQEMNIEKLSESDVKMEAGEIYLTHEMVEDRHVERLLKITNVFTQHLL